VKSKKIRFMDVLWLDLAEFVPSFDRLQLIRAGPGFTQSTSWMATPYLANGWNSKAFTWPTDFEERGCNRLRLWDAISVNSFWASRTF
jgi:hypothetical protein